MTSPQSGTPAPTGETKIIGSLADVAGDYDALLCDLWGCYHNGITPYPAAIAALSAFRAAGKAVVLLTNAPRPNFAVETHLASMKAPKDTWDAIVSSGDATRAEIQSGRFGRKLHIIGPERDHAIWEGLDIERTDLADAESILCTGLFDDRVETPYDYAPLVEDGVRRMLPFLCANPDIIVDRGDERLYCAGAIAEQYMLRGGDVFYFGKPHAPIYALARSRVAEQAGAEVPDARILAIGDGIDTDVLGAQQAGIDCCFVSGGLAAGDVGDDPEHPDPSRLARFLQEADRAPRYTIGRLR